MGFLNVGLVVYFAVMSVVRLTEGPLEEWAPQTAHERRNLRALLARVRRVLPPKAALPPWVGRRVGDGDVFAQWWALGSLALLLLHLAIGSPFALLLGAQEGLVALQWGLGGKAEYLPRAVLAAVGVVLALAAARPPTRTVRSSSSSSSSLKSRVVRELEQLETQVAEAVRATRNAVERAD